MKLRQPVMGDDEARAVLTVLRAVQRKRILVEHDDRLLASAIEALEVAPVRDVGAAVVPASGFDGATYDAARDGGRLGRQFQRVYEVMRDGCWHTLIDVANAVGAPSAGVSARIRDLRKAKFGGFTVQRRSLGHGVHAYRLLPAGTPQNYPHDAASPIVQRVPEAAPFA